MKRIYVDTEYIYDGMFYEKRMPLPSDKKQIIQIAAVLFNQTTGKEEKKFDVLIKPIFHSSLPPFFVELTSINEEKIAQKGISFTAALDEFVAFCGDYPIWTFNNDYNVFLQNLDFHSLNNPFNEPFKRVKPLLPLFGIDPDMYSSGTLYKAVGLNIEGHVHYALHDVRSMSRAVYHIEKNSNSSFHSQELQEK